MSTLSRERRRLLEKTVVQARTIAEEGSHKVLRDQYAVHHHEPWPHMTAVDRGLRNQLRAHGRQLGDKRDPKRETQEINHLVQACAYEHWHRMLFARFLAENDLLLDAQHGVAMTMDEVRELAREQGRDWIDVAAELAQRMLLAVFRPDHPVLKVRLPLETRQPLEEKLALLPKEVFQADDSLGWVYQFWQSEEKERINDSGVKIGADELPAVTELFTEDYMVWFLLHNTLGAWWTAKRKAEGKDPNLPGYQWTYLRLKEDGTPAAGSFDAWPRWAKDIKLLDPSMGSGHFLVFALPILVGFRMEEEGLTRDDAVEAVLRDNLFGLEIDPRCTQIAAFNLAWTAWRMVGYRPLPQLNLACSGLGINAKEEDWVKLAGKDERARETMLRLYHLFEQAPVLGSLIDPKRVGGNLFASEFEKVRPLLARALAAERNEESVAELAVTARGICQAAEILANEFTLVATNVPYLSMRRQRPEMRELIANQYAKGKACLSTAFLQRILSACSFGGLVAVVTPQHWLFQPSYKALRTDLLSQLQWKFVASLGTGAFETISGEVVNVSLIAIQRSPRTTQPFILIDVSAEQSPTAKAHALRTRIEHCLSQDSQLANPEARVIAEAIGPGSPLEMYAEAPQGVITGDLDHWQLCFWELSKLSPPWIPFLSTTPVSADYTAREHVVNWSGAENEFIRPRPGNKAMGRKGVAVSQMSDLAVTLYMGEAYDGNVAPVVPLDQTLVPALWAFVNSEEYRPALRRLDRAGKLTNGSLLKISFDESRWRRVAGEIYKRGLPSPSSCDPKQWLFDGKPKISEHSLQVAVARLLGYHWPRQTGSNFMDCPALGPDGLEKHANESGIVPLSPIVGEASAAHRLRELLTDAYGSEWSSAKLQDLLGGWDSLEDWLRDGFFEEHCNTFDQRPFVWHIWDGRKDGFHALVNYHKLAGRNGEGRNTLEKLIYTYLGRWIERQTDEVRNGKEGADARLTAATHLRTELEKVLRGEKPYDVFVRWKPLNEQPIGWEPDINDGVRLNIRPWLTTKVHRPTRRDGCILRATPRIPYRKDRGNEPHRPKEDFPWFWTWDGQSEDFTGGDKFDGARWNELHYSLSKKKEAREKRAKVAAVRS